jgi:hypothetical protein
LIWGWLDNTVDSGFVISTRKKFQTVPGVDYLEANEKGYFDAAS